MYSLRTYNKFYKSDIFNTSSKIEYFSPIRKNLQSSLEKTSYDIFNSNNSNLSLNNNVKNILINLKVIFLMLKKKIKK